MAKAPPRRQAQRQNQKNFRSDLKRWLRTKDFFRTPQGQIAITCAVVLVSLYIAVSAAVFHTPGPDETLLASDVSWESIFTQRTMRSVRTQIGIQETDAVYLFSPPTASVDSSGSVTRFSIPLAVPAKDRYSLWELTYLPDESALHLYKTAKNQKLQDLPIQLDQLPTDESIKTFLNFPAKYLSQTFPLPEGGVYQFVPATDYAVTDYDFAPELSKGTAGIWISSSGGGSMVDAAFNPTGEYFTYYCTLLNSPPEEPDPKGKKTSSQAASDAKIPRTKVLVMTELSEGIGIL